VAEIPPSGSTGGPAERVRPSRNSGRVRLGSVATGRARPDSDIDVAVLVEERARAQHTLKFRLRLMAELGSALGRSDVDVVILNQSTTLLAHRVLVERPPCL
jgi:predicted nucleotidyltransferase